VARVSFALSPEQELLQRTAERLQAYVDGSGAAIQRARRERSPGSELSALLNQHSSTPPEVELAEIRMKPAYIAIWTLIGTVLVMWLLAVFFTFAGLLLGPIVPFTVWGII